MFRTTIALALAASLTAFTGCGGDSSSPPDQEGEAVQSTQGRYGSGNRNESVADGRLATAMRNSENTGNQERDTQASSDKTGGGGQTSPSSADQPNASSQKGGQARLSWGYSGSNTGGPAATQSGGGSGGAGGSSGSGGAAGEQAAGGDQQEAAGEVKVIEITGNDQMQYNIKKFEVTAGQRVRIKFTNIGTLPKAAMGHDVVVLKKGYQVAPFAMAANQAAANDYIPQSEEQQKKILAHTKLLGPGETDTVDFTAPTEPGARKFLCSFPAHYVNMQGDMMVKPAE